MIAVIRKVLMLFVWMLVLQPASAQADTALDNKAATWVATLQLTDNAKAKKVQAAIATHLTAVKDWHNNHHFTLVPEGINPVTGSKLSELDRDIIICSAKPKSVHENLMVVLKTELDSAQVEIILDKYTIGIVDYTLRGYKAIVPDLTAKEETEILKNLLLFLLNLSFVNLLLLNKYNSLMLINLKSTLFYMILQHPQK